MSRVLRSLWSGMIRGEQSSRRGFSANRGINDGWRKRILAARDSESYRGNHAVSSSGAIELGSEGVASWEKRAVEGAPQEADNPRFPWGSGVLLSIALYAGYNAWTPQESNNETGEGVEPSAFSLLFIKK